MENEKLHILLTKYEQGLCTQEELKEINDLYEEMQTGNNIEFPIRISRNPNNYTQDRLRELKKLLYKRGLKRRRINKIISNKAILRLAFVILVCSSFSFWYFIGRNQNKKVYTKAILSEDVLPGHKGAILTLGNGKIIPLDSAGNGVVASQGNINIINSKEGISYNGHDSSNLMTYNTLETPKGRQYSVVLPDGSKVWLNAASTIKFPVAFSQNKRIVELRGEAYFEIVHDAKKPFIVKTSRQIIEDIGTHFNIQTYPDDPLTKTILLDGSVRVMSANNVGDSNCTLINPGEVAVSQNTENEKITKQKLQDPDDAIAWKNGLFIFDDQDIVNVMRILSRWYDIDVEFIGKIPKDRFSGQVYRNMTLKNLLEGLNFSGIQYKITGRKMVISS